MGLLIDLNEMMHQPSPRDAEEDKETPVLQGSTVETDTRAKQWAVFPRNVLEQEPASCNPRSKSSPLPDFIPEAALGPSHTHHLHMFKDTVCPGIYILFRAAFTSQLESCVLATEAMWPEMPILSITWPFTGNFYQLILKKVFKGRC